MASLKRINAVRAAGARTSKGRPDTTRRLSGWQPLRIIRENTRAYLAMNGCMYGLFLAGFGAGLLFPALSEAQQTRLEDDGTAELVQSLIANPWLFALVILAVNTVKMCVLTIVLPSMIVPFAGIALFAYWAASTGVTLVPASDIGWVALIPHSVTVVIEFQAYILVLLGVYLLGKCWIRPGAVGAQNRREGYVEGLQRLGWLSLPAAILLIVGAVYEAFSLRYFVHPLAQWLL
ncbi:stage II sporulation protein M [Mycolicibacterium arseniciresistens]|uniref:Stage II sporulation protein M n=1 Tax=Mycolicibacterium arseniciresistens TaxID=3062257 RepID=A0ABT8UBI7_9MYCO|nr:stage II sporulation protein M [Mycolicibacterium arseniciresistens]MDO3635132.1 stage II sporulation protein M [Mycolicibacterium arseniciresistens]